jgi:hypothetical protein
MKMYYESLKIAADHYKKMYKKTFEWKYLELLMITLSAMAETEDEDEKSKLQPIT